MCDEFDGDYLEDEYERENDFQFLPEDDFEPDQFMSNAEADADALASIGWGTDEDYGYCEEPEFEDNTPDHIADAETLIAAGYGEIPGQIVHDLPDHDDLEAQRDS